MTHTGMMPDPGRNGIQTAPGSRSARRQSRARQRRPRRTFTIAVAVIALVAVVAGVVVYKRSTKSPGPLPVHLPAAAGLLPRREHERRSRVLRWGDVLRELHRSQS